MSNKYPEHYNILRMYSNAPTRVLKRDVTLAEAQAHCKDPETSYTTATSEEGIALTEKYGMWFDGYEKAGR